jgi:hypothetical protein
MIVVDAHWEIRNLGKKTVEIEIEKDDLLDDIINFFNNNLYEYCVVKLPPSRIDLIFPIQSLGFKFAEILNSAKITTMVLPSLSKIEIRILNDLSYAPMTKSEIDEMFFMLGENLFETDRIAIDPLFGIKKSNNRYVGLITDEINQGAIVYSVKFRLNNVGFFLIREKGNVSYSSLAGIYKDFQNKGFGTFLIYFEILESSKRGLKELNTAFSSNNLGAQGIHQRLGFEIKKSVSIFTKHRTGPK